MMSNYYLQAQHTQMFNTPFTQAQTSEALRFEAESKPATWTWKTLASSINDPSHQSGSSHLIDEIIDCRRSPNSGDYRFQVGMYCACCRGRNYWLSEKELLSIGC